MPDVPAGRTAAARAEQRARSVITRDRERPRPKTRRSKLRSGQLARAGPDLKAEQRHWLTGSGPGSTRRAEDRSGRRTPRPGDRHPVARCGLLRRCCQRPRAPTTAYRLPQQSPACCAVPGASRRALLWTARRVDTPRRSHRRPHRGYPRRERHRPGRRRSLGLRWRLIARRADELDELVKLEWLRQPSARSELPAPRRCVGRATHDHDRDVARTSPISLGKSWSVELR